jgi:CRISPR-associated endonuclease Csn1
METQYLIGKEAPVTKLPQTFPKIIDENLMLGLDIGIGSCGQALISSDRIYSTPLGQLPLFFNTEAPSYIRYIGVRAFDVPEEMSNTGKITLKNPERRAKKLLRRVTKRRAKRMYLTRHLLKREGILPPDYHVDKIEWRKKHETSTPWQWRLEGLTRKLSDWEWAASLLHFAKHRGFKSNKKSDFDSKGKDGGTLQSSRANHAALQKYQSIAEMMLQDPRFKDRLRNREENYQAMVLRLDLENEIKLLFEKQRSLGNTHTSPQLETEFLKIFNQQKPLQDPYALLGKCPFERTEKRGSCFSYSFELSRALQKLNTLTLVLANQDKILLKDYINAPNGGYRNFIEKFGSKKSITWKDLREWFSIDDTIHFLDLPISAKGQKQSRVDDKSSAMDALRKDTEKGDCITRSTKKVCAQGSYTLRNVLGDELWNALLNKGDLASLDNAAFCLTFFESTQTIIDILDGKNLEPHLHPNNQEQPPDLTIDPQVAQAIKKDLNSDSPSLLKFKGTVSLSSKASRKLLPFLEQGLVYSDACAKAGYQHTNSDYALKNIINPVVVSVVREVMKQVVHVINLAGVIPGSICVELGRDLGKSIDERNNTARGIHERTEERNANREALAKELEKSEADIDDDMLLRYELWHEQSGLCPYCGETLPTTKQYVRGNNVQIDHILPRSRSHDNSFNNKVLVHTGCNQNKKNQTPAEWLDATHNSDKWKLFAATVQQMPHMKPFKKKRYLLNETFNNSDESGKFIARNLTDTRYISKIVLEYLKDIYRLAGEDPNAKGAQRRIFAQPGALTHLVRKAWGLEHLKKDLQGNRIDDTHHAVDALVCACLSEGQRQWITRSEQIKRATPFSQTVESLQNAYKDMEEKHQDRGTPLRVSPPWKSLRDDIVHALRQLNVSRRECRKGKGPLHNDTFYRMESDEKGNPCYYNRKSLLEKDKGKIVPLLHKTEDLKNVKGIDEPKNNWLKKALTEWIEKGSPIDETQLPRTSAGTVIRKITKIEGYKSGRQIHHGYVIGGSIVCIDIFSKTKTSRKKSKTTDAKSPEEKNYFLVPIYSYHLEDEHPPMRAICADTPEDQWDLIDESYTFEFTLWPNSLFEVQKKGSAKKGEGEYLRGYYRGVNRSTGRIEARSLNDAEEKLDCSVKQGCQFFRKLNIDRLGRITCVKGEKRVWHGKVCT